ncbi:zinc-dependent alcohol dehydrogenase [Paenibacillus silviterrae]|uniref:zinc-dependent alcohol dehydrogenase n=1 Tax=Paenibacillus silviterrae TaxID=3242194 RepID=UPI00254295E2|nr:zinc-binding alcohol dehydrogenase [Paenibacillus chinjuensis]
MIEVKGKQIVFVDKDQVELHEASWAEDQLKEQELLIETEASFISAGTELAILTAKTPKVYQKGSWNAYPWKAGYASVGTVRATGRNVRGFEPGARVFLHGKHGSATIAKAGELLVPVPEGMDASVAAATRLASISATALHVSDIPRNGWVAVFGLGLVGNFAAQVYRIMGCRVIGVDPAARRRELAEACGIPYTVHGTPEEVTERIRDITGGDMCAVTVDAVGHSAVIRQAMKAAASFGQVVLLGTPRTPLEGNMTELLADIHFRWLSLRGALNFNDPDRLREIQRTTFDWVQSGRLHIEPLISHRLKPEEALKAYDGLQNQTEEYIGVSLLWK